MSQHARASSGNSDSVTVAAAWCQGNDLPIPAPLARTLPSTHRPPPNGPLPAAAGVAPQRSCLSTTAQLWYRSLGIAPSLPHHSAALWWPPPVPAGRRAASCVGSGGTRAPARLGYSGARGRAAVQQARFSGRQRGRPAGRRAGDHRQRSLLIPAPGPSTSISPTAGDHRQRVEPVPLGASAGGLEQGPPGGRADAPRRGDSKRARGSGPPGAAGASALGLANAEQVRAGAVLGARLRRRRHVVVGLREPVFVGVGGEGKGNEGPGRASRTRRHTANGYMRRVQAGPSQLHIGREPRGISPTFTPLPCIPHIPLFRIPHIPLYPQHSPKRRNMGSRVTMLRTAVRWARKEGFRA